LFPRLFEMWPARLLGNDLGSAGFNGFSDAGTCPHREASSVARVPQIENVCYIEGQHSAFDDGERVDEIVRFLVKGASATENTTTELGLVPQILEWPVTVWLAWLALAVVVVYVGVRVVSAAPSPAWVPLVLYILLIIRTLQTV